MIWRARALHAVVVAVVVVATMTHRFWGVSLPAGGSITQKLERGSTLVLTAVGVSGGASAERTVLRALDAHFADALVAGGTCLRTVVAASRG